MLLLSLKRGNPRGMFFVGLLTIIMMWSVALNAMAANEALDVALDEPPVIAEKEQVITEKDKVQSLTWGSATSPSATLPETPTGKAAESDLKSRMFKLTFVLVIMIGVMYLLFYGFRKTPMYRQIAANPVKVKSITPLNGKSKLVLVEAYGSHLLISSNDTSVHLIKEFSPERIREYQTEIEQERLHAEQAEFETAMEKTDTASAVSPRAKPSV